MAGSVRRQTRLKNQSLSKKAENKKNWSVFRNVRFYSQMWFIKKIGLLDYVLIKTDFNKTNVDGIW